MPRKAISLARSQQGKALIDMHTPLHALLGFAAGMLAVDTHVAFGILVGARVVSEALRQGPERALFQMGQRQSLGNELTDLILEVVGLHYGELLRARLSEKNQPQA